mmetsp:Transcript_11485/g.33116  ORF Transcript_11485/g.33116 Transcript_11485/m.33116 type:complete len:229 (-) Transcript_11485:1080-1766(-)
MATPPSSSASSRPPRMASLASSGSTSDKSRWFMSTAVRMCSRCVRLHLRISSSSASAERSWISKRPDSRRRSSRRLLPATDACFSMERPCPRSPRLLLVESCTRTGSPADLTASRLWPRCSRIWAKLESQSSSAVSHSRTKRHQRRSTSTSSCRISGKRTTRQVSSSTANSVVDAPRQAWSLPACCMTQKRSKPCLPAYTRWATSMQWSRSCHFSRMACMLGDWSTCA